MRAHSASALRPLDVGRECCDVRDEGGDGDGDSVGHVSSRGNHCALFGCMAEQEKKKMMMMERKPNVGRTAEASVAVGHHLGIGGGDGGPKWRG